MIRNVTRMCIAALALLIAQPAMVRAEPADPTFPVLAGDVVDEAQVLSPPVRATLTRDLAEFRHATGHRLVVTTVASLQGREIADYGIGLFRHWKVGRQGADDGAILLIAPREHKSRIEVGYRIEPVLTDAASKEILLGIRPKLAARDYDGAALAGARAITTLLKAPVDGVAATPPPIPTAPVPDVPAWVWAIFLGFAALLTGAAWLVFRAVRAAIRSASGARALARSVHERHAGNAASAMAGGDAFASGAPMPDFSAMSADFETRNAAMRAEQDRITAEAMAMVERAREEGRIRHEAAGATSTSSEPVEPVKGQEGSAAPAEPAWAAPPDPAPDPTQWGWDPSPPAPVPMPDTSFPDPPAPSAAPDDSSLYTGGSAGGGGASDSW